MDALIVSLPRAAELLGVTQAWLLRSTCPRAWIAGKLFFLQDDCVAWVRAASCTQEQAA